jgi:hypothetical protein
MERKHENKSEAAEKRKGDVNTDIYRDCMTVTGTFVLIILLSYANHALAADREASNISFWKLEGGGHEVQRAERISDWTALAHADTTVSCAGLPDCVPAQPRFIFIDFVL